MGGWPELRTDRLLLRGWRPDDRVALAQINADPRVMEFLGAPMTREQSDAMVDRIEAKFARQGFGFWAVEVPGVAPFIGFVGLNIPDFEASFMPAVEIGWRLGVGYWGCGYASEAAHAALDFGFNVVGLDEIVAFTTEHNVRSRSAMERIGMRRDPRNDFEHPTVPIDSPLRPHVLYRIGERPRAGMPKQGIELTQEGRLSCPGIRVYSGLARWVEPSLQVFGGVVPHRPRPPVVAMGAILAIALATIAGCALDSRDIPAPSGEPAPVVLPQIEVVGISDMATTAVRVDERSSTSRTRTLAKRGHHYFDVILSVPVSMIDGPRASRPENPNSSSRAPRSRRSTRS